MLSLINKDELQHNPNKLLYLYPSMPKIRYAKMVDKYNKLQTIYTAEQVAKANDSLLVPASCIHYKRRCKDKRVVLFGRSYYVMHVDDLTALEWAKYEAICIDGDIAL